MAKQFKYKQVIYAIVIVICLGGAIYHVFLKRDDPLDQIPDDRGDTQPWICSACLYSQEMTARDIAEFRTKKQKFISDEGEGTATSRGHLVLECPKCGKMTFQLGIRCPKCGTIMLRTRHGKPFSCPQCGWNISKLQKSHRSDSHRRSHIDRRRPSRRK